MQESWDYVISYTVFLWGFFDLVSYDYSRIYVVIENDSQDP